MEVPESLAATLRVVRLLESLDVRYVIGGSLASSVHGVFRASVDADVVAELGREHVQRFSAALQGDFYLDEKRIREAVDRSTSFNVIELKSMFKVDVFVAGNRPFDRSQIERGVNELVWKDPEIQLRIASPEDTILAKLDWFRRGGEVSERQWTDVLGVLQVQDREIDIVYLRRMAVTLNVEDLLENALEQSRQG